MLIGTQILAPHGYGTFVQGTTYHFLTNNINLSRIVFVHFAWKMGAAPTAHIISMPQDEIQIAFTDNNLIVSPDQKSLPLWLAPLEGEHLALRDSKRIKPKKSHHERVELRLLAINDALQNLSSILHSEDIAAELNAYARLTTPPQNETRYRTWFLTYLCFGRNIWALQPPFHLCGQWSRDSNAVMKQGAPSKARGKNYGYKMTPEMRERCIKAYIKFIKAGKTMIAVYVDAMLKEFKCKTTETTGGLRQFYQPDGKPFPTLRQFRYEVGKSLGIENIQKNRYGSARHRRSLAAPKGKFSANVSCLMEIVVMDGYFTKEKPKGYLEGSTLPPVCVVIARDELSGAKLGIGFSFGKETEAAYRMMMFSMAVPKDYFCMLWGITLKPGEWTNQGIPPHFKVDRGPGASSTLLPQDEKSPVIRNMTPSWAAQAKATVESSHPRDIKFEGESKYFASNLTPVELARREIYALILYNHTADMSSRMEIDSALAMVAPTPHALWEHYDANFRNSAIPISIADSVRQYLTPITLTAKKDGIFYMGRRFNSSELRESGLLDRIARENLGNMSLQGYFMEFNTRHIWVEVGNQILLLGAQLNIREDEELSYRSAAELSQWDEARAKVNSEFAIHKAAATAEFTQRFQEDTGKNWDSGNYKSGQRKKNATARQEEIETRRHTTGRKRA